MLGYFCSHSAYFGSTRSTCVCCSMISDTRMWYGSSVLRHGKSRPCRRYHVSSRCRNRRRSGGAGSASGLGFLAMKIYTKTGDAGQTSLFGGTRVGKDNPRVAAYGDVDEANAFIGLARASGSGGGIGAPLARPPRELFAPRAQLAPPPGTGGSEIRK